MELSVGEKIAVGMTAVSVLAVIMLIVLILIGTETISLWTTRAVEWLLGSVDQLRETLFPVE